MNAKWTSSLQNNITGNLAFAWHHQQKVWPPHQSQLCFQIPGRHSQIIHSGKPEHTQKIYKLVNQLTNAATALNYNYIMLTFFKKISHLTYSPFNVLIYISLNLKYYHSKCGQYWKKYINFRHWLSQVLSTNVFWRLNSYITDWSEYIIM